MVRYKSVICDGTKVIYRYICPNYANLLELSGCSYKYLPDDSLKSTVSRLIAREADLAVNTAALLSKRKDKTVSVTDIELARAKSEQKSLKSLRERLMRDLLSGILSEEDHARMKQRYAQESRLLEERISQLQKEQYREKTLLTAQNPWLAAFQTHSGEIELTAGLVSALVDRITVYAENRVEIQLKYRDERAELLASLSGAKEASA